MNENEAKIYDLISSKSFAELTEDEKAMALDSLGSADLYEKMREAQLAATEALSDAIAPPEGMKASVMVAFEEKDKRHGIVWWKYAAAVALLVVGAFVFRPSGNSEREPIAENVERKDSIEQKKEGPTEVKKAEKVATENAAIQEEIEIRAEEIEEPTNTSSESTQISVKKTIAESRYLPMEEELKEMDMDLADESTANYSVPETANQAEPTIAHDGAPQELSEVSPAPKMDESFDDSASFSVNKHEMATQNINNESTRSAKVKISADVMKQGASFEVITLKSIGGPDTKAYVAY